MSFFVFLPKMDTTFFSVCNSVHSSNRWKQLACHFQSSICMFHKMSNYSFKRRRLNGRADSLLSCDEVWYCPSTTPVCVCVCVWVTWRWSTLRQQDLLFYWAPHLISSCHGNQSARLILHHRSLSSDSFHPRRTNHKSQPFTISATHSAILFRACLLYPLHFALSNMILGQFSSLWFFFSRICTNLKYI